MYDIEFFDPKTGFTHKSITTREFLGSNINKNKFIKEMHTKKYWLRCSCTSPSAYAFPRLVNNKYHLVNDPINGLHSINCPLYTKVSGARNYAGEKIPVIPETLPKKFTPIKVADTTGSTTYTKHNHNKNRSNNSNDKIHALMTFALSEAKFNYVHYGKEFNLKSLYYTEAFKTKVCNAKYGRPFLFSDLAFIDPNREGSAKQWRKEITSQLTKFPENIPPQAYIIFTADNVVYNRENHDMIIEDNSSHYKVSCSKVSHHYESTKGPRLVVFIIAIIENKWTIVQAYTHPITSTTIPVLVDSNVERSFVESVLAQKNSNLSLFKYYHYTEYKGNKLLPDFRLNNSLNKKSEIIEVMGMDGNIEYENRKKRLIPLMEARFKLDVSEVRPGTLHQDTINIINKVT